MSVRFKRPAKPAPPAGPMRPIIVPDENVVRAMKSLCDIVDALTLRVEALEAAQRPGVAVIPEWTEGQARDGDRVAMGGHTYILRDGEAIPLGPGGFDAMLERAKRATAETVPTDSEGAE